MEWLEAFASGWCVASFWAVLLVPVFIAKTAFSLPLD